MFPKQWIKDIIENARDKTYPIPQIGKCYIVEEDDKWMESKEIRGHYARRGNSPTSKIPMKKGDIIKIISGQYYGTYGISNFWHWKLRNKNESWSKDEFCGYGGPWIEVEDPDMEKREKLLAKLTKKEKELLGLE